MKIPKGTYLCYVRKIKIDHDFYENCVTVYAEIQNLVSFKGNAVEPLLFPKLFGHTDGAIKMSKIIMKRLGISKVAELEHQKIIIRFSPKSDTQEHDKFNLRLFNPKNIPADVVLPEFWDDEEEEEQTKAIASAKNSSKQTKTKLVKTTKKEIADAFSDDNLPF